MSEQRRPSELARLQEIRRVGRERTARVAATLSEAFAEDPLMAWIFQNVAAAEQAAARTAWWSFMLSHGPPGAEVHVTGDSSGAACWHPPASGKRPAAAVAEFARLVCELATDRAQVVLESFARIASRSPAEPHWHLAAVGVLPERQGEGLGARLLAPMLARCDRLDMPAYLESSNPCNLGFYERLGFTKVGEVETIDEQVALTLMWHPPGKAK